jgi:hypothetical protein
MHRGRVVLHVCSPNSGRYLSASIMYRAMRSSGPGGTSRGRFLAALAIRCWQCSQRVKCDPNRFVPLQALQRR